MKKKILVVDDDPDILKVVSAFLGVVNNFVSVNHDKILN